MINAGRLKDKVKIYRPTAAKNDSGGDVYVNDPYLNTYAEVTEISSDPAEIAKQENVKQVVKVLIRFRPNLSLSNGDLMEWRGSEFILNNFKVDARRTSIEMYCTFIDNTSKRSSESQTLVSTFDSTFDSTFF